jgi:predicted ATPase
MQTTVVSPGMCPTCCMCLQVGDVFSATALKALLEALTAEGCVVVTTSNRHPADLPRHGLHEAMFGHFLNTCVYS